MRKMRFVVERDNDTMTSFMRALTRRQLDMSDDELARGNHLKLEPCYMLFTRRNAAGCAYSGECALLAGRAACLRLQALSSPLCIY